MGMGGRVHRGFALRDQNRVSRGNKGEAQRLRTLGDIHVSACPELSPSRGDLGAPSPGVASG